MKFSIALVLTALLGFAAPLFMPWWGFAITSALVAVAIHQKAGKAFLSGFLGIFLLYLVLAWLKDSANQHILSIKIAQVLPLGGSWMALLLVTAFINGLVSGLAALSGSYLRKKSD
jgi:hypothetical protein